ncbi:glycosyltransferase family A protein [Aquimarina sp. RZ0]|uniref:glycosyltransferase family 2 protein n=1 Tax=Aquimarina sp. RZ0 TaxID=2607730 RepID=UPI0011F3EE21|nr:glycosyltransferase family A protein [Aquimarina sp. RZ0]KAA1247205.1 glycosyltransferase family 2 protein [Aquimarina sp. RZ0]
MLSILIPVYNYNAFPLIKEIHRQALSCSINFEIIVFDDGSHTYIDQNNAINNLSYCKFNSLDQNIGRSAIRNLLASEATYNTLLFIDSGTFPENRKFIQSYLDNIQHPVVTGGMTCLKKPPKKPFKLRWMYTKKRESTPVNHSKKHAVICSSNFLIQKEVFEVNKFDESLKKYGCEDVIFFDTIYNKGITIHHIDNPVIHDARDDATAFIKKTECAIENLIELINTKKLPKNRYKVSDIYYKINKIGLDKVVFFVFKKTRNLLKKNLNSSYPLILCYDFYRLGYFCLKKNKK